MKLLSAKGLSFACGLLFTGSLQVSPSSAQGLLNNLLGQPNYYGGLEMQGHTNPLLYNTRPILIQPSLSNNGQPVYLRVPSNQRQNWTRYCGQYNACNRQVNFVQDGWYNSVYAPRYRELNNNQNRDNPGDKNGPSNGKANGSGNGKGIGHIKAKGNGHDNGKGNGHSYDD